MKKIGSTILISLFFLACSTSNKATQNTIEKNEDYIIEGNFKLVEADNLDNIYLVDKNNGISVYDKDYKKLFQYSVRSLGNITEIDVRNPQKILVYYGDYLKVIFLDNTLSQIKQLDFETLGFWDVQSIALSRDNYIWMYDPVNGRLQKINDDGEILISTNENFDNTIDLNSAQDIAVQNDKVLVLKETQILIFDEFGNFLRSIPLQSAGIKIIKDKVLSLHERKVSQIDMTIRLESGQNQLFELPENVNDYMIRDGKVIFIDDKGLYFKSQ